MKALVLALATAISIAPVQGKLEANWLDMTAVFISLHADQDKFFDRIDPFIQKFDAEALDQSQDNEQALEKLRDKYRKQLRKHVNSVNSIKKPFEFNVTQSVELGDYNSEQQAFHVKYINDIDGWVYKSEDCDCGYSPIFPRKIALFAKNMQDWILHVPKAEAEKILAARNDPTTRQKETFSANFTFVVDNWDGFGKLVGKVANLKFSKEINSLAKK